MNVDFSEAVTRLQVIVDSVVRAIPNLIIAMLMIAVFFLLARLVRVAVMRVTNRARYRRGQTLGMVLGRLCYWLVLIIGFALGAVIIFPEFSFAQMIQLFGLGSVAVGFAFRDVLQNFLTGIILLLSEPFRIGDQIISDNYEGTVETINTRATTIRTYDGRRVVIPNSDLYTMPVVVLTAFERRRIDEDVRITYDSDIAVAKALIMDAIEQAEKEDVLVSPPPTVVVTGYENFYINLRVRWWIDPPLFQHLIRSRDLILTEIKTAIDADDRVHLAVPERRLVLPDDRVFSRRNGPGD